MTLVTTYSELRQHPFKFALRLTDYLRKSPALVAPVDVKIVGFSQPKYARPEPTRAESGSAFVFTNVPDGTYDFGISRTIGVFGGKGKLTVQDGKLSLHGDRGNSTLTLFEGGGKRVLRGDGVLSDGTRINSELTPVR